METILPRLFQMNPVMVTGQQGMHVRNGIRHIITEGQILRGIADEAIAGHGYREPLLKAALQRRMSVALLPAKASFNVRHLDQRNNAAIVLLGRDGARPDACLQLPALLAWANRVVLQDQPPEAQHYDDLAKVAWRVSRLLIVETAPSASAAWSEAIRKHLSGELHRLAPSGARLIAA